MPNFNHVRERREACGLTRVALAERANLTRQSIVAIEAGRAIPSVDVAFRIARALDGQVPLTPTARRVVLYCTTSEGSPCPTWPQPVAFRLERTGNVWLVSGVDRSPPSH